MSVKALIEEMALGAKEASRDLRKVGRIEKDAALKLMAKRILDEKY